MSYGARGRKKKKGLYIYKTFDAPARKFRDACKTFGRASVFGSKRS